MRAVAELLETPGLSTLNNSMLEAVFGRYGVRAVACFSFLNDEKHRIRFLAAHLEDGRWLDVHHRPVELKLLEFAYT
jgi:hypothetical protein